MLASILRVVLKVFYIFPIKRNKVVLQAYNGRLYTCSPKYIAEGLAKTGRYAVYYALKANSKDTIPAEIAQIKYRSLLHFYHLMTAGFVIFNSSGITGLLPYRKRQIVIQTWHGGYSFKVIGNDFFKDQKSRNNRKLTGDLLTYFLSGSKMATDQHARAMSVSKHKFLNIGLPRNDILFHDHSRIKEKVFLHFGLELHVKLVLYAPTYRDGPVKAMTEYGLEAINDAEVVSVLEERFGGNFVFLYKAHHDMIPTNIGKNCVNASDYSDIQELMCAADVLITDYSSCMADFALQRKPGFLFTPDLIQYESVHPFSMDVACWPYQAAQTNEELLMQIREYDEQTGRNKIEGFLQKIGNCDVGHAMDSLLEIMDAEVNKWQL